MIRGINTTGRYLEEQGGSPAFSGLAKSPSINIPEQVQQELAAQQLQ